MSDEKNKIEIQDEDDVIAANQAADTADTDDSDAVGGDDASTDSMATTEAAEAEVDNEFVDLAHKCSDLESKLLRAHADYQNVIRRSHQEVANAREHQLMDVAKDLLTVLDHFDHAVAIDPQNSSAQDVLDGVLIVRDELMRTLERFGIQRLTVEPGDEFDPNRHEAMMRQPSDDLDSNQVVMQLQPGYLINDKTLRPAKVSVAE